jgi:transposase
VRSPPSILTAAYRMLRDGTFYQDLGADHFDRPPPEDQANRLVGRIERLGLTCALTPAAPDVVSV